MFLNIGNLSRLVFYFFNVFRKKPPFVPNQFPYFLILVQKINLSNKLQNFPYYSQVYSCSGACVGLYEYESRTF